MGSDPGLVPSRSDGNSKTCSTLYKFLMYQQCLAANLSTDMSFKLHVNNINYNNSLESNNYAKHKIGYYYKFP